MSRPTSVAPAAISVAFQATTAEIEALQPIAVGMRAIATLGGFGGDPAAAACAKRRRLRARPR